MKQLLLIRLNAATVLSLVLCLTTMALWVRSHYRLLRTLPVLLCLLFLWGATTPARDAQAPRPWRVLMVHSFGSSAPPFTTHSTAFATTIKQELGMEVDLDEVSQQQPSGADRQSFGNSARRRLDSSAMR
jgi:hypothetical protein